MIASQLIAFLTAIAGPTEFTPIDSPANKSSIFFNKADEVAPWHAGWSDATMTGDLVFVSGIIVAPGPGETASDLQKAFARAFQRLEETLRKADASMDDVVEITAYLTDVDTQIPELDMARLKHMRPPYAASTVVQVVRLIPPGAVAELRVIARRRPA